MPTRILTIAAGITFVLGFVISLVGYLQAKRKGRLVAGLPHYLIGVALIGAGAFALDRLEKAGLDAG